MANEIHYSGEYHHVDIAPDAHLDIAPGVEFSTFTSLVVGHGATLKLGERVFFNSFSNLNCAGSIEIGKDTMCGCGVRVIDANHQYSDYHVEKIAFTAKPIKIGKNCWLGANVVVLPGVTIGDNVIIGANTTVYKDVPANSIVHNNTHPIYKDRPQKDFHVFTFTASDTLEQLTYLVEHLPQVQFHIAAPTNISDYLRSFDRYDNITLYTNIHHADIIDDLLEKADIYLDINHYWEVDNIIPRAIERQKTIFAFDNTVHGEQGQIVFSQEKPEQMVTTIQEMISEKVTY